MFKLIDENGKAKAFGTAKYVTRMMDAYGRANWTVVKLRPIEVRYV